MITILEKGKYEMRCNYCKCLFSYEDEDVEHDSWGNNEYKDTIVCPQCKRNLIIVGDKGF